MLSLLKRTLRWLGLSPTAHVEPAHLGQHPLTMRRIDGVSSSDFAALVEFVLANPRYRLQTQFRQPSRNDALDVVHDLPRGAKAEQKYLWGVWDGDTMIGFIEVIRHWPQAHYIYIGQLMIGERWQRQGHGRTVLNMLAERSGSWAGVRRWRLAAVASQTPAIAFWKSAGFVETGQREASPSYRAPLVLMEKVVAR